MTVPCLVLPCLVKVSRAAEPLPGSVAGSGSGSGSGSSSSSGSSSGSKGSAYAAEPSEDEDAGTDQVR